MFSLQLSSSNKGHFLSSQKFSGHRGSPISSHRMDSQPASQPWRRLSSWTTSWMSLLPSCPMGMFTQDFQEFVNKCLMKNPTELADLKVLMNHAFIKLSEVEDVDFAGQLPIEHCGWTSPARPHKWPGVGPPAAATTTQPYLIELEGQGTHFGK